MGNHDFVYLLHSSAICCCVAEYDGDDDDIKGRWHNDYCSCVMGYKIPKAPPMFFLTQNNKGEVKIFIAEWNAS